MSHRIVATSAYIRACSMIPSTAFARLNPGTGSMIPQTSLASLFAALFAVKMHRRQLVALVNRKSPAQEPVVGKPREDEVV